MVSVLASAGPCFGQEPVEQKVGAGSIYAPSAMQVLGSGYRHQLLKLTVSLWADGHGDTRLDDTVQNVSSAYLSSYTWCYDFRGQYWGLSVSDDNGPLVYTASNQGDMICVSVAFRYPVPIGLSYHFTIKLSVGNMSRCIGDFCESSWEIVQSELRADRLVEDVYVPANAVVNALDPFPTSQYNNHFEWVRTTWYGDLLVHIEYTLSSVIAGIPVMLQGTIPVDGKDIPWEADIYDNYGSNQLGETGVVSLRIRPCL